MPSCSSVYLPVILPAYSVGGLLASLELSVCMSWHYRSTVRNVSVASSVYVFLLACLPTLLPVRTRKPVVAPVYLSLSCYGTIPMELQTG